VVLKLKDKAVKRIKSMETSKKQTSIAYSKLDYFDEKISRMNN